MYLGTTPDEQYPVLMQYYPEPAVEGSFHVRRIRYQGKADFPFSYGDIFVTEDIVNPVKNVITADVDWKKTDNCGELSDIRRVAYRAEDYIGETIYDAVTGERITDIFFVVPN